MKACSRSESLQSSRARPALVAHHGGGHCPRGAYSMATGAGVARLSRMPDLRAASISSWRKSGWAIWMSASVHCRSVLPCRSASNRPARPCVPNSGLIVRPGRKEGSGVGCRPSGQPLVGQEFLEAITGVNADTCEDVAHIGERIGAAALAGGDETGQPRRRWSDCGSRCRPCPDGAGRGSLPAGWGSAGASSPRLAI